MEIFRKTAIALWRKIASLVKESVVFIDNYSAECLHWCGGVDLLFENGALCVKEFSSFESGNTNQIKAVFVLSTPLTGESEVTLEDIIRSSSFLECVLVCGSDAEVHNYVRNEGGATIDLMREFSSKINGWTGHTSKHCSVEVLHLPIFMAPIAENVFVTPAFDAAFPTQEKDFSELELPDGMHPPTSPQDLHFYMFPKEYRTLMRMIAGSFRSFFHHLHCKEEIFALGPTSRLLAVQLSNISNQNKTSYPNKIGVLLVDRTLDLMSVVSHSERTLIDQMLGILPGLPCHLNNISTDMSPLCNPGHEKSDEYLIYPGCLVPDTKQNALLSVGINSKLTEAISIVKEKLESALEDEGTSVEDLVPEGLSLSKTLKCLIQSFEKNPGGILYNSVLLQFAIAIVHLLDDPVTDVWKKLAMEEKLLLQQLVGEVNEDIVRSLIRLANTDSTSFHDFCSLLIYASFALSYGTDSRLIQALRDALVNLLRVTEYSTLSESFIAAFNLKEDDWSDSSQLTHIADKITKTVTQIRSNPLQDYKTVKLSDIEPPSHNPLLPQVVERIFHGNKPELQPDIEHITTGRKDILKMGMSMFRKVTPPRPNDFPVLVIYVLGGISTSEVAQMNKVLEKHSSGSCQVVIGTNRLISPSDVVDAVLFNDNLHPDIHN